MMFHAQNALTNEALLASGWARESPTAWFRALGGALGVFEPAQSYRHRLRTYLSSLFESKSATAYGDPLDVVSTAMVPISRSAPNLVPAVLDAVINRSGEWRALPLSVPREHAPNPNALAAQALDHLLAPAQVLGALLPQGTRSDDPRFAVAITRLAERIEADPVIERWTAMPPPPAAPAGKGPRSKGGPQEGGASASAAFASSDPESPTHRLLSLTALITVLGARFTSYSTEAMVAMHALDRAWIVALTQGGLAPLTPLERLSIANGVLFAHSRLCIVCPALLAALQPIVDSMVRKDALAAAAAAAGAGGEGKTDFIRLPGLAAPSSEQVLVADGSTPASASASGPLPLDTSTAGPNFYRALCNYAYRLEEQGVHSPRASRAAISAAAVAANRLLHARTSGTGSSSAGEGDAEGLRSSSSSSPRGRDGASSLSPAAASERAAKILVASGYSRLALDCEFAAAAAVPVPPTGVAGMEITQLHQAAATSLPVSVEKARLLAECYVSVASEKVDESHKRSTQAGTAGTSSSSGGDAAPASSAGATPAPQPASTLDPRTGRRVWHRRLIDESSFVRAASWIHTTFRMHAAAPAVVPHPMRDTAAARVALQKSLEPHTGAPLADLRLALEAGVMRYRPQSRANPAPAPAPVPVGAAAAGPVTAGAASGTEAPSPSSPSPVLVLGEFDEWTLKRLQWVHDAYLFAVAHGYAREVAGLDVLHDTDDASASASGWNPEVDFLPPGELRTLLRVVAVARDMLVASASVTGTAPDGSGQPVHPLTRPNQLLATRRAVDANAHAALTALCRERGLPTPLLHHTYGPLSAALPIAWPDKRIAVQVDAAVDFWPPPPAEHSKALLEGNGLQWDPTAVHVNSFVMDIFGQLRSNRLLRGTQPWLDAVRASGWRTFRLCLPQFDDVAEPDVATPMVAAAAQAAGLFKALA